MAERKGGEVERLSDRDVGIWRAYCGGATQEAIARRFKISQPTVHRAIQRVRDSIPAEDKEALVKREIAFLDRMRDEMIADFEAALPPAFDQKGNALRDPETGKYVRDSSVRFAAFDRALRSAERLAKLLGLDAPARVETASQSVSYILLGVDDSALR